MKVNYLQNVRRHLVVLAIAAFVALTAAYAPMVLDEMAATDLTPAVFACGHSTGGC